MSLGQHRMNALMDAVDPWFHDDRTASPAITDRVLAAALDEVLRSDDDRKLRWFMQLCRLEGIS